MAHAGGLFHLLGLCYNFLFLIQLHGFYRAAGLPKLD